MKHKNKLNINLLQGVCISVLIYLIGLVIDNYNVIAGNPSYYRALLPVYSSISILFFIYPILVMVLSYLLITSYWFTSYKDWLLIRLHNSNALLKRQLIAVVKCAIVFTISIWIFGIGILFILDRINNFTNYSIHQGILAVFGNILGIFLLLMLTIIYNIALMLIPMILNYLVNKKWQVLLGSIGIELFLPILLFNLSVISEKYLTFTILNNIVLVNKGEISKLAVSVVLIILVALVELLIIVMINLMKRRRKF